MKKIIFEAYQHGSRERFFSEYGSSAWHRAPTYPVGFLHDVYDWWTQIRENLRL